MSLFSFFIKILASPLALFYRYRLLSKSLKNINNPDKYTILDKSSYINKIISRLLFFNWIKVEFQGFEERITKLSLLFIAPTSSKLDFLIVARIARKLLVGEAFVGKTRLVTFVSKEKHFKSPFYRALFRFSDSHFIKTYKTKREQEASRKSFLEKLFSKKRFTILPLNLEKKEIFEVIKTAKNSLISIVFLKFELIKPNFFSLRRSKIMIKLIKEFDKNYHIHNKIERLYEELEANYGRT